MNNKISNFTKYKNRIKDNIIKSFPWIKSREKLCITVILEIILINTVLFLDLNNPKSIVIQIFLFSIIWTSFSYVLGRYEICKKSLFEKILNQFYLAILPITLLIISNKIFNLLIYKNNYQIISIEKLVLILFFSTLIHLIINNELFNLSFNTENWIFINKTISKELVENILKNCRININYKFLDFDEIINLDLYHVQGIVIDESYKYKKKEAELIYNLKSRNIKIISLVEWAGVTLQRYPVEIMDKNNSLIEKIFQNLKGNNSAIRLKRVSEFFISIFLLFLSLPIILISALLIKIEDGGPVFYFQDRTGYKGKVFKIIKLRTMKIDSEKNGPLWSKRNDSRITRIGKFLRKSRIDEIPQLLLVIDGKLSLIGPRPERPNFDIVLKEKIPFYNLRYFMKPGLSGWAQVNFPYGASQEDAKNKLSYDIYYIHNYSNLLDLVILFKTIKLVFNLRGAIALN